MIHPNSTYPAIRLASSAEELGIRTVSRVGAGLNRVFGPRDKGGVGILMYHRVAHQVTGVEPPTVNVTPPAFHHQIGGLIKQGWEFWPLRDVLDADDVPANVLVLTFDDGYEGVYHYAWPVLREWNVPATIFLCTAFLDGSDPFPFDAWALAHRQQIPGNAYRPLSTAHVREMNADALIDFGAHTHTHQDFRDRPAEFADDLRQSVDIVRELTSQPADRLTFAFPFGTPRLGFANERLADEVRHTGLRCALTTECCRADGDPFAWGRFNVFPWDNAQTIAARVNGWYGGAARLYRRGRSIVAAGISAVHVASRMSKVDVNVSLDGNSEVATDTNAAAQHPTPHPARTTTDISIVVPTHNRADWLRAALATLVRQTTNGTFEYEIIVVDNASTDHTRQAVEAADAIAEMPVRYLYQPKRGDAPTRNAGVQAARSEWVAFFDDDQFADPGWLAELFRTAVANGARLVGGPVHLDLPASQLQQLGTICRRSLREIRYYRRPRPYKRRHLPGTGNAFVHRQLFDEIGSFDESLVRGGSDIDFFVRARQAGHTIWYTPRAVIHHRVSAERLSRDWLRSDAMSGGAETAAYFDSHSNLRLGTGCLARIAQASFVHFPLMAVAWLNRDYGAVLGRQTRLWRTEGYVRKTLEIFASRNRQSSAGVREGNVS